MKQGSYPIGSRTLVGTDTLTGVATGSTADIPVQAVVDLTLAAAPTLFPFGLYNKLINPNFEVWQRGVSFSIPGNTIAYTADRWRLSVTNGATGSVVVSQLGAGLEGGSRYALRMDFSAAGLLNSFGATLSQIIETANVIPLQGQALTLSVRLRRSTAVGNINLSFNAGYGTDVFPIGGSGATAATLPTTAWQTVSIPINMGSDYTSFAANIGIGNTYTGQLDISHMQLEVGTGNRAFESRPIGLELSLCQRYFQSVRAAAGIVATSTAIWRAAGRLSVAMRASPTAVLNTSLGSLGIQCGSIGGPQTVSAITTSYCTGEAFEVDLTITATTASPGSMAVLLARSGGRFDLSAEL